MKTFSFNKSLPLAVFIISMLVYGLTCSPYLTTMDSGELAAAQATLGIAHPTGYPLFTMLGHFWSKLPLGLELLHQINLLSAIFCAGAVYFFYRSFYLFIEGKNLHRAIAASGGSLTLAFSLSFWAQSTGTEVYALHMFLLSLALFSTLKSFLNPQNNLSKWMVVGLLFGLSFSNHMSTLFLVPGLLYLYFQKEKWSVSAFKKGAMAAVGGLAVLTACCSYLYFRAQQNPLMNWGDPSTLSNLFYHLRGEQYNGFLFSSWEVPGNNFRYFLHSLPDEFSYAGIALFIYGAKNIYAQNNKAFNFWMINLLFTTAFAINYDIPDLSAYFLLAYISICFFISVGIKNMLPYLNSPFLIPTVFALPIYLFFQNYTSVNQRDNSLPSEHVVNALNSVPENAIVFTDKFDTFSSGAFFYQLVKNVQREVVIIETTLLINSAWYPDHLRQAYPEFAQMVDSEMTAITAALQVFRSGHGDESTVGKPYSEAIVAMVSKHIQERPIYIDHETYNQLFGPNGFIKLPFEITIIPQNYFYRLSLNQNYQALEQPIKIVPMDIEGGAEFVARTQQEGIPPIEYYRHPRYLNYMIPYDQTLLTYHRMQYEIFHQKWEEANFLMKLIQTHYPSFQIDASLRDKMRQAMR